MKVGCNTYTYMYTCMCIRICIHTLSLSHSHTHTHTHTHTLAVAVAAASAAAALSLRHRIYVYTHAQMLTHLQPRMSEHMRGSSSLGSIKLEHGHQEICQRSSLINMHAVLVHQNRGQIPEFQASDIPYLALAIEKFQGIVPIHCNSLRHAA